MVIVAVVSLVSAFIILLAKKVGIIEWMQVHGDKFISQMASCDFCLSFWTGTVVLLGMACCYDEPLLVFGGVLTCPLTRLML